MKSPTKAAVLEQVRALQSRNDELSDRLDLLQRQHEEDLSYRQHTDQNLETAMKTLVDIAPFARTELQRLSHDHPSVDRYDELLALIAEHLE